MQDIKIDSLVTIAIPFYNSEEYLDYAIRSVFNQTYTNWELILLDDGSSDNSLEIAKKYGYDERVKIISDHLNRGLVYRLNQSIMLAKGKFYARMDADDIMHVRRIETQVQYLNNNADIDVLGTAIYIIDSNSNIKGTSFISESNRSSSFFHPSVIGKTEWFINNKYDSRFERAEDTELWLRTQVMSKFYNIDEPLLFYRLNENNLYKKYLGSYKSVLKILKKGSRYKINRMECLKSIVVTYVKIIAYTLLHLANQDRVILKLRTKLVKDFDGCAALDYYNKSIQYINM